MTDNIDLSIVIVSYNSSRVLPRCLSSIIEHTRAPHEIIVADNASSDGTPDMVDRDFPTVRVVRRARNDGLSAAINDGVAASRGMYIAQLNPDIYASEDALTPLVDFLRAHTDAGIVAPKLLDDDGSLQLSCRRFPGYSAAIFNRYSLLTRVLPGNRFSKGYLMSDYDHASIRDVDWVSGAALVLPRAVFDRVGGWDAGFFMFNEDVDLCRRVHDARYRVVYNPTVALHHTIGVSAHASAKLIVERHRSIWRYYRKHLRGNRAQDAVTAAGIAARCGYLLSADRVRRVISSGK